MMRMKVRSALGGLGFLAALAGLGCGDDEVGVIPAVEENQPAPPTEQGPGATLPDPETETDADSDTDTGAEETPATGSNETPDTDVDLEQPEAPEEPTTPEPGTFWTDGVTVNGLSPDVDDRFHGLEMDADDNTYAVGYLGNGVEANRVMVVAKFDSAGQPVTSFGTDGRAEIDISPYLGTPVSETVATADGSVEEARDVALQSDGKLVVVGRAEDPNDPEPTIDTPIDIAVFRLNADGTRDETFGAAGLLQLNPGSGINDLAWGIDVDGSDRIYVFGHGTATNAEGVEAPRTDQDRYVWRLNADGTLDETFGVGGQFSFDTPQGTAGLALNDNQRYGYVLPNGQIVTGGYTNVAGRNQIVLARLLEDGTPDAAFSGDGVVRLAPFPTGMAECYGMAFQSDGSLVTTGYGNVDVERTGGAELLDMVSFRVTPDGTADPTWGVGGAVVYDPAGAEDRGRAVVALADDRILFAGATTLVGGNKDAMLLLLDKDGAPAVDFDAAVHKAYEFGGANEEFFGVKVSPSGKFVAAAGYATGTGLANGNAVLAIVPIPE